MSPMVANHGRVDTADALSGAPKPFSLCQRADSRTAGRARRLLSAR
jgi:hypothetical protein